MVTARRNDLRLNTLPPLLLYLVRLDADGIPCDGGRVQDAVHPGDLPYSGKHFVNPVGTSSSYYTQGVANSVPYGMFPGCSWQLVARGACAGIYGSTLVYAVLH